MFGRKSKSTSILLSKLSNCYAKIIPYKIMLNVATPHDFLNGTSGQMNQNLEGVDVTYTTFYRSRHKI